MYSPPEVENDLQQVLMANIAEKERAAKQAAEEKARAAREMYNSFATEPLIVAPNFSTLDPTDAFTMNLDTNNSAQDRTDALTMNLDIAPNSKIMYWASQPYNPTDFAPSNEIQIEMETEAHAENNIETGLIPLPQSVKREGESVNPSKILPEPLPTQSQNSEEGFNIPVQTPPQTPSITTEAPSGIVENEDTSVDKEEERATETSEEKQEDSVEFGTDADETPSQVKPPAWMTQITKNKSPKPPQSPLYTSNPPLPSAQASSFPSHPSPPAVPETPKASRAQPGQDSNNVFNPINKNKSTVLTTETYPDPTNVSSSNSENRDIIPATESETRQDEQDSSSAAPEMTPLKPSYSVEPASRSPQVDDLFNKLKYNTRNSNAGTPASTTTTIPSNINETPNNENSFSTRVNPFWERDNSETANAPSIRVETPSSSYISPRAPNVQQTPAVTDESPSTIPVVPRKKSTAVKDREEFPGLVGHPTPEQIVERVQAKQEEKKYFGAPTSPTATLSMAAPISAVLHDQPPIDVVGKFIHQDGDGHLDADGLAQRAAAKAEAKRSFVQQTFVQGSQGATVSAATSGTNQQPLLSANRAQQPFSLQTQTQQQPGTLQAQKQQTSVQAMNANQVSQLSGVVQTPNQPRAPFVLQQPQAPTPGALISKPVQHISMSQVADYQLQNGGVQLPNPGLFNDRQHLTADEFAQRAAQKQLVKKMQKLSSVMDAIYNP